MDLLLEPLQGDPQDPVMVESQRRDGRHREPAGVGRIIPSLDIAFPDQGQVGDGNHPLTRIAVHGGESAELGDGLRLEAGFFHQFAPGAGVGILVHPEETARKGPAALERVDTALDQENRQAFAKVVSENDAVGRNGRMGVLISVHMRVNPTQR